jgi:hypothetical protein
MKERELSQSKATGKDLSQGNKGIQAYSYN